jgi:hypothetical protein
MTLNCDLGIDAARENFAKRPDDETTADLLESTVEHWRCDKIDDAMLAKDLRWILTYLERNNLMPVYGSTPID